MLSLKNIGALIFVGFIATIISIMNTSKNTDVDQPDEQEVTQTNQNTNGVKRLPASQAAKLKTSTTSSRLKSITNAIEVTRSKYDRSNFTEVTKEPSSYIGGNSYNSSSQSPSYDVLNSPVSSFPINVDANITPPPTQANDNNPDQIFWNSTKKSVPAKKNVIVVSPTSSSSYSSKPAPIINTCSSNITSGSFSNPIAITLSCTSVSDIKYCLALDTGSGCCDPSTTGTTYSSQIVVGPTSGTYCLSYYGDSISTGSSTTNQQNYTINTTYPNLQIGVPQTNYQTTQLNGKSFVTSLDYGKVGYSIGQINLKTHDPSSSAENLDCEEIITNYVGLPSPFPLSVLNLLNVSTDGPSTQIEIPLRLDQLDYGDNFITTYIGNFNPVTPVYSCSTTKVVLNDFDYFEDELAFGDTGDNSVREFSAGLSPYGFFEAETVIFRGPAGVSSEDNTGQKLQNGMFGIFY